MVDKCKYCGSTAYGSGCMNSPHKKHEHGGGVQHCIFLWLYGLWFWLFKQPT